MLSLKTSFFVLILFCCVYGKEYHSKYYGLQSKFGHKEKDIYSFDQLYKLILKTISCLEKTPDLSINSTFVVVQALGFINEVFAIVPNFNDERTKNFYHVMDRLAPFIHRAFDNYPDFRPNMVWWPYYWGDTGDWTNLKGRVPKNFPFTDKTFMDILADTVQSEFVQKCNVDFFNLNDQSLTYRHCNVPCEKEMFNMNYDSGIPPEEKAWYVGNVLLANCTNLQRQTYEDYAVHCCAYVKREIDTMLLYKHEPIFYDSMFYYGRKIGYCAAYGLPEFLCPKLIMPFIKKIDCRGCVASDRSAEDSQVLTAQTINILGLIMRSIIQKDYGVGSF